MNSAPMQAKLRPLRQRTRRQAAGWLAVLAVLLLAGCGYKGTLRPSTSPLDFGQTVPLAAEPRQSA